MRWRMCVCVYMFAWLSEPVSKIRYAIQRTAAWTITTLAISISIPIYTSHVTCISIATFHSLSLSLSLYLHVSFACKGGTIYTRAHFVCVQTYSTKNIFRRGRGTNVGIEMRYLFRYYAEFSRLENVHTSRIYNCGTITRTAREKEKVTTSRHIVEKRK